MSGNADWVTDETIVRHSTWMLALLRGMLPDAEVEDALQNTWLKVIRSSGRYRGDGIKAYLASVARTVAIDRLRQLGKTISLDAEGPNGEEAPDPVDPAPTPTERFESAATREDVRKVVRELPAGQRQVLLLRIEAEMSFREIAAELGIPLGTALTWMHKATARLKRDLGGRQ